MYNRQSAPAGATTEERSAVRSANNATKREAITAIINYINENVEDVEILSAAAFLTPVKRGSGVKKTSHTENVIALMGENGGSVDEVTLFNEARLGRSEMRRVIRDLIKGEEGTRLWIHFDADEGIYTVLGSEDTPPDGWTGYNPVDVSDL